MPIPSRVLGSGINSLSTVSICGDGGDDLVAVGTSAGDALQLVYVYNSVDTTPPNTGVKLPTTEMGATVMIANSGAHTLSVYPPAGSTLNGGSSASIAVNHASIFFAVSNSAWYSLNGERV
jgi:hypothetical protein